MNISKVIFIGIYFLEKYTVEIFRQALEGGKE